MPARTFLSSPPIHPFSPGKGQRSGGLSSTAFAKWSSLDQDHLGILFKPSAHDATEARQQFPSSAESSRIEQRVGRTLGSKRDSAMVATIACPVQEPTWSANVFPDNHGGRVPSTPQACAPVRRARAVMTGVNNGGNFMLRVLVVNGDGE